MTVVDASVWVSYFLEQDAHHARSHEWLTRQPYGNADFAIPNLCVVEVAGAIARRTGESDLSRVAVRYFMNSPAVHVDPSTNSFAVQASLIASSARLRGADAVYVALARRLRCPLVTWDVEMLSRVKHIVTVGSPDTFHMDEP